MKRIITLSNAIVAVIGKSIYAQKRETSSPIMKYIPFFLITL